MAKKIVQGNDIYDLLIDIIFSLSPKQATALAKELVVRYTSRGRIKRYNAKGELDPEGLIRLLPFQYKQLRTKFGDSYIKKAFTELSNYIEWLQEHIDDKQGNRQKLTRLSQGTHMYLLGEGEGWVYMKCKSYICKERPRLNLNPYLIDDLPTAREYVRSLPEELRDSIDVKALYKKFPQLADPDFLENGYDDE